MAPSVVVSGILLERLGLSGAACVCVSLAVLYTVLGAVPVLGIQPAAFALFGLWRGFFFSFLWVFLIQIFGPKLAGRAFGATILVGAAISSFSYLAAWLAESVFESYQHVSIAVCLCVAATYVFPLYLRATAAHAESTVHSAASDKRSDLIGEICWV